MPRLVYHEDGKSTAGLASGSVGDCKHMAEEHAGKALSWSRGASQVVGFASSDPFPHYEISDIETFEPTQENTASPIADAVFELVNALKFAGATSVSIHITLSDLSDEESAE